MPQHQCVSVSKKYTVQDIKITATPLVVSQITRIAFFLDNTCVRVTKAPTVQFNVKVNFHLV